MKRVFRSVCRDDARAPPGSCTPVLRFDCQTKPVRTAQCCTARNYSIAYTRYQILQRSKLLHTRANTRYQISQNSTYFLPTIIPIFQIPQHLYDSKLSEQVVRRHRRSLVDRALGVVPAFSSAVSIAPTETAAASPLVSLDGFRAVVTRFEKLSRSALPRGVSDLVYGDAYLVALAISRHKEVGMVVGNSPPLQERMSRSVFPRLENSLYHSIFMYRRVVMMGSAFPGTGLTGATRV